MSAEKYLNRCLTCKHWLGNKVLQRNRIKEGGDICMDLQRGWPTDGECQIQCDWSDTVIDGNAGVTLDIDANHGCIRWEAEAAHD